MASSSSSSLILVTALVAILMVGERSAQVPSCASNLIACANYLNSTKPPESCCKPLRKTVANELVCLCNLYNDPSLLPSLGINITQALALPQYCGVSADTSRCNNNTAPAPSSTTPPPPPPPGVARDDRNSAGKMAWSGGSGLLLLWVFIMAY